MYVDIFLKSLNAERDLPDDILPDDGVIRYKVLEKGSKRGGRLLVDINIIMYIQIIYLYILKILSMQQYCMIFYGST